jgi:uncharacterized protein
MTGELNPQEIEEILSQQTVGRIGCHADGMTYVVPIGFAYDGEYIYGHTLEGLKIQMMRKNPEICFEVDFFENSTNWKSVIAWGRFEELTNGPERHQALITLHQRILPMVSSATVKLNPDWPFTPKDVDSLLGVVYRVKLEKKTGRFDNKMVPSF